jgi:AcrR family transcriptional regulator
MPPTPPPVLSSSRRQRGRDAAVREIKAAALDELRLHGARGVTMRGVARAIDMTPSGLYRYFDDHRSLLAALCVDAQESLRETLEDALVAHADDDDPTRWFRGSVVLREWALGHVDEYALAVGPRLAGVDPQHPDLVAAASRLMSLPCDVVIRAIAAGALEPQAVPAGPVSTRNSHGSEVPGQARAIAAGAVYALVGAVSLEAFGQLGGASRAEEYAAYSLQVMGVMGWVGTPDSNELVVTR